MEELVELDCDSPIWDRFYTVNPLVLIGSKEEESYNLAPKHMATALGWENYFGFVCTPDHQTYQNIKEHRVFTVSYPRAQQTVLASLAATCRCEKTGEKPIVCSLPTFPAKKIDGVFIKDGSLFFECTLDRFIDGFAKNSLIVGKITAAYVDRDYLRCSDDDEQQMVYKAPLLAYLDPGRFAEIKQSCAFPFPADFRK
ncbi:flavin reductase family protein [Candidatus Uabimicrobium amorphum]|uniref:Flavin reductase like domain-containing protein n=1 Tax=Uabimicrobium amorphum TaxID=2596890 RepID=A0A5S9INC1_UABAM|nr:flavin reductase family protein [Candidatus Uabimicrobium amorphum]BBM84230.1 hypothetical protein UABAM_02586 [Candidatus Uabimicrobium amorphum]